MRVDCHTHIGGCQGEAERAEHLEAAEKVDACVVLATPEGCSDKDTNKEVAGYVGKHRERMAGFAFINPVEDGAGVKQLASMRDKLGFRGVVVYCAECDFHPAHSKAMQLYEAAEELGMPVFFHNAAPGPEAVLNYAQPYLLDEIARAFKSLKIVIGNMGGPFLPQTLCMVGKHENVYADLTISPGKVWEVYNVVVAAHESGVMDKLLFGSGFPDGDAGACTETLLGFNKLLADTNLPTVPRGSIRNIIERDSLELLGIRRLPEPVAGR